MKKIKILILSLMMTLIYSKNIYAMYNIDKESPKTIFCEYKTYLKKQLKSLNDIFENKTILENLKEKFLKVKNGPISIDISKIIKQIIKKYNSTSIVNIFCCSVNLYDIEFFNTKNYEYEKIFNSKTHPKNKIYIRKELNLIKKKIVEITLEKIKEDIEPIKKEVEKKLDNIFWFLAEYMPNDFIWAKDPMIELYIFFKIGGYNLKISRENYGLYEPINFNELTSEKKEEYRQIIKNLYENEI